MSKIVIFVRATAALLGSAAAGVGCYAAYEAAAKADGGYLMVGAPVVALAAALTLCFIDFALRHRQWGRAAILAVVWLPCAATVFFAAAERYHLATAGAEAERAALRTAVDRAQTAYVDAKRDSASAIKAADKVRGLNEKQCKAACLSTRAAETQAISRAEVAERDLLKAQGKAVTEF